MVCLASFCLLILVSPLKVLNSIGFNTVEFGESGRTVNGMAIGGRAAKPAYKRNLLEEGLLSPLTYLKRAFGSSRFLILTKYFFTK